MSLTLQPATEGDFPAIVDLMNAAFRGAEGWSIEADYITGVRTSDSLLREEIAKGAMYLTVRDGTGSSCKAALVCRPRRRKSGTSAHLLCDQLSKILASAESSSKPRKSTPPATEPAPSK